VCDLEVGSDVVLLGQLLQRGSTEILQLHLLLAIRRHGDTRDSGGRKWSGARETEEASAGRGSQSGGLASMADESATASARATVTSVGMQLHLSA